MRPGGTIVYPLTVTNLDPDPAENVVIKDPTNPDLVRGVSVPSGCTVTVGTLASGERTHLSIDVRVEHGHGSITVIGNCAPVY